MELATKIDANKNEQIITKKTLVKVVFINKI